MKRGLTIAELADTLEGDPLLKLDGESRLRIGRKHLIAVLADELLAGRIVLSIREDGFEPDVFAELAAIGGGARSKWIGDGAEVEQSSGVVERERSKWIAALADDAIGLLVGEPGGLACDTIAKRLRRRRAAVLAALRDDERVERTGVTRTARWRLVANGRGTEGDGMDWPPTVEDVLDVVRELQDVLRAYNASAREEPSA